MPTIYISSFYRAVVLQGLFGVTVPVTGIVPTLDISILGGPRYLRAYGTTTPVTTLTQLTNPITTPITNVGLENLATTPALINFDSLSIGASTLSTMTLKNASDSALLTIPAGRIVYYVGIFDSAATTAKPMAWIRMSNPPVNYNYTEQGTLKIPANGYTVNFPA